MKRHPTTLRTSTAQIKGKRVRKCVRNSPFAGVRTDSRPGSMSAAAWSRPSRLSATRWRSAERPDAAILSHTSRRELREGERRPAGCVALAAIRLSATVIEDDEARLAALEDAVRSQLGEELRLLEGFPETANVLLAELWARRIKLQHSDVHLASLAALSLAADSIRAAVRDLLACDLLAVYSSLRRSTEFVVLASAVAIDPGIGDRWMAGEEVGQRKLRVTIDGQLKGAGDRMRGIYYMLSDYAHGRVDTLALYANRWAWFEWPIRPDGYDRKQLRVAHEAIASLSLHHWEAYRIVTREWSLLGDDALRNFAQGQERLFVAYVRDHTDTYQQLRLRTIADGRTQEWLVRSLTEGRATQ